MHEFDFADRATFPDEAVILSEAKDLLSFRSPEPQFVLFAQDDTS